MKTVIAAILAIILIFSLAACSGEEIPNNSTQPPVDEDSSFSYLDEEKTPSAPDEKKPENEEHTMTFKLGPGGETAELSAGDALGDWTLESLDMDTDTSDNVTPIDYVYADFSGTVILEGYIECNRMLEHGYDFIVSEADRAKLPYIVIDNISNRDHFLLSIPEDIENTPDLDPGETLNCKITVNSCSRVFAHTEAMDKLEIVKIETDFLSLYEEMLIDFGGNVNYEGKLTVSKFASLYYNLEGYKDCSALDGKSYYTWIRSRTGSTDNCIEVNLPGFSSPVFAYEEDYYEAMIQTYFDVSSEYLRKFDSYYPEQRCYYIDPSGGGIGNPTYISLVSAEENGDTVVFHLTIDYKYDEDYNMAQKVRIDSDGSYKYLSYLPE